jgi:hypothetical protein
MSLLTKTLAFVVTAASANAGLVTFTVAMSGPFGAGVGAFDDTTHIGSINGLAFVSRGIAARADIVDRITGSHVKDLSLVTLPAGRGSFNFFLGGPIHFSPGEYSRFITTNLCVQLINGNGTVLSKGVMVPVPEPALYASAASLALTGFVLWRRRNT